MGLKKVFNLRRISGINGRGAVEDDDGDSDKRSPSEVKMHKDDAHKEDSVKLVTPKESMKELAIAIVAGESDSIDSRLQMYTLPNVNESVKDGPGTFPPITTNQNKGTSSQEELVLQVYEFVDAKNDDASDSSLAEFSVDEITAFEILSFSSSKDYHSVFSGLVASDAGSIGKAENASSDADTEACGSLITKCEGGDPEDKSTAAIGPEIVLSKEQNFARKHTLKRFFSIMTLLEGKGTTDETDRATASASLETNSLAEKSIQTSSTSSDETANESESSSVAIALFADEKTPKAVKTIVLSPTAAAANRDAKTKVVSMMIDHFKQIAGKGSCFCENNSTEEVVYELPDININGIFSRDAEDSDGRISCVIDHDDTFTLDSMIDGNRMYL